MFQIRLNEVMGDHGVKQLTVHINLIIHKHLHIKFQILPDFSDGFLFKYRSQFINNAPGLLLIRRYRYILGFMVIIAQGYPDQLRLPGVQACCFGIKTKLI